MNKQETIIEITNTWFRAFNTKNLDLLLSLYHADAQHYSPKLKIRQPDTQGFIKGNPALRAWWQDSFERLPTLYYTPTLFTANDERVFMEYVRKVDGEPNMLVAEALEIREGLIVASRVYHG